MDKYIKLSDALDRFTYENGDLIPEIGDHGEWNEIWVRDVNAVLKSLPAADVAPVVRCRECKHYTDWGACGNTDNGWDAPQMGPDDFCSRGERKTDGN